MAFASPFLEIAAILALATLLGMAGQKLRQPLLIMFLLAGILVGPSGLGLVQSYEQIDLLAHIGIALLLFIVGLKLDLHLVRTIGPVALATGLGQIIFTSVIGFAIAMALGMNLMSAAYVSVALTFSSTIIIVKLLSDKREIDSLHGQIAIGFLIVQDIAAILALVTLTALGAPVAAGESAVATWLTLGAKGLGLLGGVALLMKFVLPPLIRRLAQSQEMLTLFAIAWAVSLAAFSDHLGFSKEVGAFLAGFSLASTSYRDAIGSRLTSLRDFLLLFFFIDLGARLDWSTVGSQLGASAIFSLFVLVGNPLIVVAIMGYMGYRRRTGLLAGLTVAQISEFSLIVAALGLSLGHINRETMGLITLVGVVTIFFSTYMILYSAPLYRFLSRPLRIFERRDAYREASICYLQETPSVDFILMGLGNYGSELAEYLLRRNRSIVGVDFDPEVLERWRRPGLSMLYGDMEDPELLDHLPLKQARWVVSTVRSRDLNLALMENLRTRGFDGNVAFTAADRYETESYEKAGASIVFQPYLDAADQAAEALSYAVDILPERVRWPATFREVAVRPDSTAAGREIRDLALRQTTGASILALRRAGHIHFDPEPNFRLEPGDRLVIVGSLEELKEAEANLNRFEQSIDPGNGERIEIAEIPIGAESGITGRSLADIRFRQTYGAMVIGIRRSEDEIKTLNANTSLRDGDSLIVIGTSGAIDSLRRQAPL